MRRAGDRIACVLLRRLSGGEGLTFSRRLGHDADRRVGETAQFVLAVTAPGSLDPCGRGIRKIQKVRLLHAAIRYLISGSGRWDAEADGRPEFRGGGTGVDALPARRGGVRDRRAAARPLRPDDELAGRRRPHARPRAVRAWPVGSLTKMVGAGILSQRVVGMAGRHSASFSIPVPPELERRWTASGVFPRIDPELIEIARAESG